MTISDSYIFRIWLSSLLLCFSVTNVITRQIFWGFCWFWPIILHYNKLLTENCYCSLQERCILGGLSYCALPSVTDWLDWLGTVVSHSIIHAKYQYFINISLQVMLKQDNVSHKCSFLNWIVYFKTLSKTLVWKHVLLMNYTSIILTWCFSLSHKCHSKNFP